jgi:hypothetical protein
LTSQKRQKILSGVQHKFDLALTESDSKSKVLSLRGFVSLQTHLEIRNLLALIHYSIPAIDGETLSGNAVLHLLKVKEGDGAGEKERGT